MPEETFGARLRRERERRHIALSSISENTKIRASLFEGLERNDVSHWPSGIFRKAYIRAYAKSVGLDEDAIAKEFLDHYPDPADATPDPVEAASRQVVPATKGQPLVTVTVRVPRWMTDGILERLSTAVRPWSRA